MNPREYAQLTVQRAQETAARAVREAATVAELAADLPEWLTGIRLLGAHGYTCDRSVSLDCATRDDAIEIARKLEAVPIVFAIERFVYICPLDSREAQKLDRDKCRKYITDIEPWKLQVSYRGWPTPWVFQFWADICGKRTHFRCDLKQDSGYVSPRWRREYGDMTPIEHRGPPDYYDYHPPKGYRDYSRCDGLMYVVFPKPEAQD